jgi:pimeloyl-ACP methyl ester carboxylesterase
MPAHYDARRRDSSRSRSVWRVAWSSRAVWPDEPLRLRSARQACEAAEPATAYIAVMHVDVRGLAIAYERAGSGPPVVLAHGFVGDGRSTWGSQIDALADEFTVVAWDAPGAGSSSDPPEDFGMDDYADCFAGFIRALRIEQADLVGLSFGGALVLATFHRHRALASSLALVSGYAGWRGSLGPADAQQRLSRSLEVSELRPDEFADVMVPSMFSPSVESEVVAPFADSVRAVRPGGFRAMARACFEDQSHVLPEVDVPTLLLYADHDLRAPVAVGEAMHALVRGSNLVVLRGPGHVSSVEAPNDVTRELRRFLRSIRPSEDAGRTRPS